MNQPFIRKSPFSNRTINRLLIAVGVVIAIGSAFWAARVTQAEFEVPLVDTTDFVPTDFRSVWMYNRQVDITSTQSFKNYEGYAVGKPTQSEDGSSALYRYVEKNNGPLWVKMFPQGTKIISSNYQLNAVGGQYDNFAGYANIVVVGRQDTSAVAKRQAYMLYLENSPVDIVNYPSSDPAGVGRVILDNYTNPDNAITASFRYPGSTLVDNSAIPLNSELYAIGMAARFFSLNNLAGGEHGWLANRHQFFSAECATKFYNDTSASCSSALEKSGQESWTLFQLTGANVPGTDDNITGITYVDEKTVYVTTSTFPLTDGHPKSPYERDCSGSRTSKLFRVIGNVRLAGNWVKIAEQPNECFYGLTATVFDQPAANNGPLKTEVWVASSAGVRWITDDAGTYPSTLVKATADPVYGVVATYERSGNGQQLLLNGDFQSWTLGLSGANATNHDNVPSGWFIIDPTQTWVLNPDAPDGTPGECSTQKLNIEQFPRGGTDWAVKNEPGLPFSTSTDCTGTVSQSYLSRPHEVSQVVKLTGIEGTRYRVSGSYKVNATTSTRNIWLNNPPVIRQGGVITRCTGRTSAGYTYDCPFSNLQEMHTLTGASDPGMTDYKNFSFEFTRTFNQLDKPIQSTYNFFPRTNYDAMYFEIVCSATYGVRVVCDNLKVEEVDDPVQPFQSAVKVIAVGRDGLALRNNDAVGTPTSWVIDDANLLVPLTGSRVTLNSIVNAGGDHIFAAGSGTTLFQRSFGNVSGYAWLGAAQPGTTGLGGLGWLATGCANLKDASQRSLCQRQPESFGLSLDLNSSGMIALTGRAWLGKQLSGGTNNDNEGLDLGVCQNSARPSNFGSNFPYSMDLGTCSANRCTGDSSVICTTTPDCKACNTTTRTCRADATKACSSNFDCYGRCAGDQGYICVSDNDCSATKIDVLTAPSTTSSPLAGNPPINLQCNATGGSSSSNACTAAGWLTLNADDLAGANTPPSLPGFGVVYNQSNCTTSATDPTPRAKSCTTSNDCIDIAGTYCLPGALSGWGRFMTPANTQSTNYQAGQGWVKFRGPVSSPPANTKIYAAQNCKGPYVLKCSNNPDLNCTVGNETATCGISTAKCVNASSCSFGYDQTLQSCRPAANTCTNFCGGSTAVAAGIVQPCTSDAECSSLWNSNESCKPVGYCSNTPSAPTTTCTTDSACGAGSFCMFGALCNVGAANSCNSYGVDFDETKGKFQGFAWSAEDGWLDFRNVQKGSARYLQTRLGDIYTRGNISSESGALCAGTATYLITASGTINNFCSDLTGLTPTGISAIQPGITAIPFSSANNAFTNALGRFDLTGIETVISGGQNKYLQTVTALTPAADGSVSFSLDANGQILDGTGQVGLNKNVYTVDCTGFPTTDPAKNTCRLTQGLKIPNAGSGRSGAGILVVKGNLTITNNLQYVSSLVDDLRRLASLVIVVRGDLNIENQVTHLVGAYYVDGTVYTTPTLTAPSTENHYPLTVRGLMIARKFVFNRKFAGTVESPLPSELFIFDGRLQSNPLPGMVDFASALPNTFNSSP